MGWWWYVSSNVASDFRPEVHDLFMNCSASVQHLCRGLYDVRPGTFSSGTISTSLKPPKLGV